MRTNNNEYLVDLTVYIGGSAQTLHFTSGAGRNYGGVQYEGRIRNPGSIKYMMFADGTTMGASQIGYGVIEFANTDGGLDWLINAGFSGRACMIRELIAGVTIGMSLSCSMEQPVFDSSVMSVRVKDPAIMLNIPVQPNKYGGTNSLPAGIDGTTDIQGKPKPLLYGQGPNVTPVCVNTSRLIYQLHDGALYSISNVYDKGVALVFGADRANNAAMQSTPPAAGTYDTCLVEGLIRLGSSPFGVVTVDAIQGATAADRTAAQIAKTVALKAIGSGDMVAGDFTALDTLNSSVIGIYITEETLIPAVLDEVLNSIGGWYGFDSAGKFNVGRLDAPSGTAAASLTNYEIQELQRLATQDEGRGLPTWKVNLGYNKNFTVQNDNDLAGKFSSDSIYAWEIIDLPVSSYLPTKASAFGNGVLVVFEYQNGIVIVSTDRGRTWSRHTLSLTNTDPISAATFGDGLFVAMTSDGSASYTSIDGYNWFRHALGINYNTLHITYGNGLFVASVAGTTGTTDKVLVSTDGITWNVNTIMAGTTADWYISYGNGIFTAVYSDQTAPKARTTTDGVTWTARTAAYTYPIVANEFFNGTFLAMCSVDDTRYSMDAVSWNSGKINSNILISSLSASKDAGFVGLGSTAQGNAALFSKDANVWISKLLPAAYLSNSTIRKPFITDETIGVVVGNANKVLLLNTNVISRRYFVSSEYRTATLSDSSVQAVYLNGAQELNINTLLVSASDAQTEATRQLNLRKVRRDYIAIKIKRSALTALPDLGSIINVTYPRFGYDIGKKFVLIGFEMFLETDDLTLYLWG